ncbi:unnamed protein product, partial [Rotaria sp. Silwood2]
ITFPYHGRLYGADASIVGDISLVQAMDNSSKYDRLLDLNRALFVSRATATRNIYNESYVSTYFVYDDLGVSHYFLFTIDVEKTPKLINNVSINGPGYGSFWQIADDETQLVEIRESAHPDASLKLAVLDQTIGRVNTICLYAYGTYSLVMAFGRQRRIYYNIISSSLFCGVNVDSGI